MNKRTIIITGATGGIGKELSMHFAKQQSFNLVLLATNKTKLKELLQRIIKNFKNIDVHYYDVNLAKEDDVKQTFQKIITKFNTIDILINNAAISGPVGSIESLNLDTYKATIDVNLYGAIHCITESLEVMKPNKRGKIINICGAGVGWNATAIEKSAYTTSKYALYGLSESLSRELMEYDIDINCISPGSYDTKLRDALVSEAQKNNSTQDLNDVSKTIGNLINFLISKDANGLSGKIFSSIYDKPDDLLDNMQEIKNSSDYTIRKIDNINFKRIGE